MNLKYSPCFNRCLLLAITLICLFGCKKNEMVAEAETAEITSTGYPIEAINIRNIKLKDKFWLPIIERVQQKTIEYAIEKCREEGRFDNFLIAGGKMPGEVKGAMPFDDTDVYKIIEGASNSLISSPNPELEKLMDSLVSIIKVGQESDGYLTTWRTINPAKPPAKWVEVKEGKRWESLFMSHELYNAGHLYEAAVVHFKATGKRNFLDIAIKNADLMVDTFGDGDGKIAAVPGHQIIETGLIQLYQVTGKKEYMDLAKYFLDHRGDSENHELFGPYSQDHFPVVDQDEVVGHAVRAVYMYAGMTDIAAIEKDTAYLKAVNALWNNMVDKKMYITGGIGAKHDGEAFGENYELPNLTAYNETCAAIGDVYWNHRLHNLTGDVKYFDVIERTLYNGLISGLSLDGQQFFYPNALESDGVYKFNQGACTRKDWFDCSCCPTNVIRFIPAMPGLIYSKTGNTLYVNLYASNEATVELKDHHLKVKQETMYPWDGKVKLTIDPDQAGEFTMKLRIPGWARNQVLHGNLYHFSSQMEDRNIISVNDEQVNAKQENGYFTISRTWQAGDVVELSFPMEVRKVMANQLVEEDRGKMSLEYGPLVYAVEEMDNKIDFDQIGLYPSDRFKVELKPDLLGGVNTVSNEHLTAIPYYAWSNRGVGKMKIWLPVKEN
ncbi:glycoside hydrolase family 127 protein [Muricauda sp. 40Bstr401]|uniref:Glycoside hydrolase family 127 protein n=2 Tax=Flagellimonas sediminis TaxID=2696468 RepID=A0A6I5KZ42_9FLAO|nr:glycoside hydrolase family 127 protein [Allomuricauda sediminis]